jgi:peptidoglycan/xylan/chitin deacetylase (PgdA/CDA1 family)
MRRRHQARSVSGLVITILLASMILVGCATELAISPALSTIPTPTAVAHIETAPAMPRGLEAPTQTTTPTVPRSTHTVTVTITPSCTPTATASVTPTVTPSATPTSGPTPDGVARTVQVPILMYHYISEPPSGADIYRVDLSVTPDRFESHLRYLTQNGYHIVTLDDLLYALAQGRSLPAKPVILTFDDGYEDNYRNAFPLLQKHGMVGHFFIITDFVNEERDGYMTWAQIEAMSAAGQRFGSHSRDHPDLNGKSFDYLVWQALGGTEAIEEHLGYHPRWVSYPSGSYDQHTIDVFKSADYWGGLSTRQGSTHTIDKIFELKRVRVRGSTSAEGLGALLMLDW